MEREYLAMLIIPVSKIMMKREKEDRVFFIVDTLSITVMTMIKYSFALKALLATIPKLC